MLGCLTGCGAAPKPIDPCSLITAGEVSAIVGATARTEPIPGHPSVCTLQFERRGAQPSPLPTGVVVGGGGDVIAGDVVVQLITRSQVDAAASSMGAPGVTIRRLDIRGADVAVELLNPHINVVYLRRGDVAVGVGGQLGRDPLDAATEERVARIVASHLP